MTQDQIFEDVRAQMRKGVDALNAFATTLKKCHFYLFVGSNYHNEQSLNVRCDDMDPRTIEMVFFIAKCNFLKCSIVVDLGIRSTPHYHPTGNVPYIKIKSKSV